MLFRLSNLNGVITVDASTSNLKRHIHKNEVRDEEDGYTFQRRIFNLLGRLKCSCKSSLALPVLIVLVTSWILQRDVFCRLLPECILQLACRSVLS